MVIFCSLSAWLSEPCLGDGLQITNGLEEESVELSWGVAQVQVHIISFLLLCIRELKQSLKAYFLHRKCTDVRPISEVSSLNYSGIQIVYFHHGTRKIRAGIIKVPVVKFRLQWCYILYTLHMLSSIPSAVEWKLTVWMLWEHMLIGLVMFCTNPTCWGLD